MHAPLGIESQTHRGKATHSVLPAACVLHGVWRWSDLRTHAVVVAPRVRSMAILALSDLVLFVTLLANAGAVVNFKIPAKFTSGAG